MKDYLDLEMRMMPVDRFGAEYRKIRRWKNKDEFLHEAEKRVNAIIPEYKKNEITLSADAEKLLLDNGLLTAEDIENNHNNTFTERQMEIINLLIKQQFDDFRAQVFNNNGRWQGL